MSVITRLLRVSIVVSCASTDCNVGEHGAGCQIEEAWLTTEDVVRRVVCPEQERRELQTDGNERAHRLPRRKTFARLIAIAAAQNATNDRSTQRRIMHEFAKGGGGCLTFLFSPLPLSLASPLPFSLPSPPTLELVPLKPARWSGGLEERCKLPQWGRGQSPGRKRILCTLMLSESCWWQSF